MQKVIDLSRFESKEIKYRFKNAFKKNIPFDNKNPKTYLWTWRATFCR